LLGMNHHSHLFSQAFLEDTQVRSRLMFRNQSLNLLLLDRSKYFDIAFSVGITDIQPELIELVRRSITRVQPDIARFRFTELAAVSFRYQRASQCKNLSPVRTANQFRPGSDIPPLVGTAHLELATLSFIQMKKIISLEQLVRKLGKRQPVARFTVQTAFYGIFHHHVVHRNVLPHFTSKIKESEILHP